MRQPHEGPAREHLDTELVGELARQRCGLAFTGDHLAARKLPAPRQMLTPRALGNEHAPFGVVQRRRDDPDQGLLHARERAVAVLVLLARAARTGLVAADLALTAHERGARFRLGGWGRGPRGAARGEACRADRDPAAG